MPRGLGNAEVAIPDPGLPRTVWHCVITTPLMYLLFINREALGVFAARKRAEYLGNAWAASETGKLPRWGPPEHVLFSSAVALQVGIAVMVGVRGQAPGHAKTIPARTIQSSIWLLRGVLMLDTFMGAINSLTILDYVRYSSKECAGFAVMSACISRRYFFSSHLSFLSKWLFSGLPVKLVIVPEFFRNALFVVLSMRILSDQARATGEPIAVVTAAIIVLEAVSTFAAVVCGVALMHPGPVRGELNRVDNCPTPWLRRARNRIEAAALSGAASHPTLCHFVGACFAPGLTPLIVAVSISMGFYSLHEMSYFINLFLLFVMVQQIFTLLNSVSAGFYASSAFGAVNPFEIFDRILGRSSAPESPADAQDMVTKLWMVDKSELQLKEVIGAGSFSTVWRAQWRGSSVAVKVWNVMEVRGGQGLSAESEDLQDRLRASLGIPAAQSMRRWSKMDPDGLGGSAGRAREGCSEEISPSLSARRSKGSAEDALAGVPATPIPGLGSPPAAVAEPPSTFLPEVELLLRLRHPNILTVFAVVKEPPMLVMALGARGTLHDVLSASTLETLSWGQRLEVLRGVACGLAFLHTQTPPIYHMDLKSRNVIMSASMEPQLADFGLSGTMLAGSVAEAHSSPPKNAYAPPEVLMDEPVCGAALDAYGFGNVMNNIITVGTQLGGAPAIATAAWRGSTGASWDGVQVVFKRMADSFRIEVVPGCPPPLAVLLERCCAREPHTRPAMVGVLAELNEMVLAGCPGYW